MVPGRIFRHERFYLDRETGLLRPKYFLVLAIDASGDCTARLLTSRAHARPERPRCFHETPYPGYFLGIPGQGLDLPTWVDLRFLEDFDGLDFQCFLVGKRVVIVHAFVKKTEQTPDRELALARKRAREVQNG